MALLKSGFCMTRQAVHSLWTVKVQGHLTLSHRSPNQAIVTTLPHPRWVISCAVLNHIWLPLLFGLAHVQSAEKKTRAWVDSH